jgi:hypothetical protein
MSFWALWAWRLHPTSGKTMLLPKVRPGARLSPFRLRAEASDHPYPTPSLVEMAPVTGYHPFLHGTRQSAPVATERKGIGTHWSLLGTTPCAWHSVHTTHLVSLSLPILKERSQGSGKSGYTEAL